MIQDVEARSCADEVICSGSECKRRFRATCMIPTLSRSEHLGKLRCPHCGKTVAMDPRYVWVGIPV